MTAREYYDSHFADFQNVINTQHILVEKEEDSLKLLERIQAGEDFAKLAEEYSLCPTGKESGGVLGFYPNGAAVAEYENAARSLEKEGDMCGPVKSQFGYHIIRLVGKKDVLEFSECENLIQMMLDYQKEQEKQ